MSSYDLPENMGPVMTSKRPGVLGCMVRWYSRGVRIFLGGGGWRRAAKTWGGLSVRCLGVLGRVGGIVSPTFQNAFAFLEASAGLGPLRAVARLGRLARC